MAHPLLLARLNTSKRDLKDELLSGHDLTDGQRLVMDEAIALITEAVDEIRYLREQLENKKRGYLHVYNWKETD